MPHSSYINPTFANYQINYIQARISFPYRGAQNIPKRLLKPTSNFWATRLYQVKFLLSCPTFDLRFSFQGRRSVLALFSIHNLHDFLGAGVVAAYFIFMLVETALYIGRDTGVKGFVAAFN